jgi:hypothetical protein
MYCGHVKEPTVILESIMSHDLWIWHAFFGLPGSNNNINVLHRFHLFDRPIQGETQWLSTHLTDIVTTWVII